MLWSCQTAEHLHLIGFAFSIHLAGIDNFLEEFQPLFQRIRSLKDKTVQLHIDKCIQSVALRHRRVAFHLSSKVEEELHKLEAVDIIEWVEGPTPCVSPIVVTQKPGSGGSPSMHRNASPEYRHKEGKTFNTNSQ